MVLEDASSDSESSASSFSENVPTSDIDRYAGGNGNSPLSPTSDTSYIKIIQLNAAPIYLKTADIPRQFLTPPPSTKLLTRAITDDIHKASELLRRPVRQEEAEALAFYFGKRQRVAGYGVDGGIAIGALQSYRTRHVYRFPFYTPMKEGSTFNPLVFGPLRGETARLSWHAARFTSWIFMGAFFCVGLTTPYAESVALAGRMTDPRLKEYAEAVKQWMKDRQGALRQPQQQNEGEGARGGETFEMAKQRRGVQRQVSPQGRRDQVDDMSPTAGIPQQDLDYGQADSGLMDDSQVRSADQRRQQEQSRAAKEERDDVVKRFEEPQGRSPNSMPSTPSRTSSSGSSWDRLRQNAISGKQDGSTNTSASRSDQNSRNSSSGSDSFTFSQGEEDRQLARGEAQKEFDARMDREREGKDFEEGRGGKGRW